MVALMNCLPNTAFGVVIEKCNARAVVVSCFSFSSLHSLKDGSSCIPASLEFRVLFSYCFITGWSLNFDFLTSLQMVWGFSCHHWNNRKYGASELRFTVTYTEK